MEDKADRRPGGEAELGAGRSTLTRGKERNIKKGLYFAFDYLWLKKIIKVLEEKERKKKKRRERKKAQKNE